MKEEMEERRGNKEELVCVCVCVCGLRRRRRFSRERRWQKDQRWAWIIVNISVDKSPLVPAASSNGRTQMDTRDWLRALPTHR